MNKLIQLKGPEVEEIIWLAVDSKENRKYQLVLINDSRDAEVIVIHDDISAPDLGMLGHKLLQLANTGRL